MTPSQKRQRLIEAMTPLVGLPQFAEFIDTIRELRDVATENAVRPETLKNQRTTLAAAGEVRAYLDIIAIYEAYKGQAEEREFSIARQREEQAS